MILQIIIYVTILNVLACITGFRYSRKISKLENTTTRTWNIMALFFFLMTINTAHGIYFIQGLLPQVNTTFSYLLLERYLLASISNCIGAWGIMRIYYTLKAQR